MIDSEVKLPFYAKATIFLVGLFALFAILYIAQDIIVPLIFASIIAILLTPLVNFFVRKKVNRVIAIAITLFVTFLFLAGFGLLIFSQASRLGASWPMLVERFTQVLNQSITWAAGYFDINSQQIYQWIKETEMKLVNSSSTAIGKTLLSVGSAVMAVIVLPIYIFLILFYQPLLLDFIYKLFSEDNQSRVTEIIIQIKTVIQRYLIGLVIEAVLVASLYTVALLILGVDYALLLGIIGALLNLIPYVGGIVGAALPMMVALATKSSGWYALYVMVIYTFIQLVDNNLIVPKIVASKVKINAIFSILVVISGNALWGISGMFLSIPLLAIVKLIFDHIESLKPWGFLLGDTMPPILVIKPILKKKK